MCDGFKARLIEWRTLISAVYESIVEYDLDPASFVTARKRIGGILNQFQHLPVRIATGSVAILLP
ncbi:MAG: hypothetical protein K1X67_19620 [Fimbriimonadaceae bacterium]|nr:hypothetical protein [Fimbriimonadaceae bacterium]